MTSTQFALPPDSRWGRVLLPALALTLGALYFLTRSAGMPPVLAAGFGVIGVAYLPGLAAALWVERRFGLWATWILPLMLAPVLTVGAALLLTWSGFPLEATAGWIVFLSVLAMALAPEPRRELEEWAVSTDMPGFLRQRSDRQQVVGLATIVLVLIAVPLLSQPWLGQIGDAAFHGAVVREAHVGGLPPQDPYLAGAPLRYFWAFHVYLGVLESATLLDTPVLLLGGSLVAAFVLLFAGYRLLSLLGLSHARSLWGGIFLFFALNGFPWLNAKLPGAQEAGRHLASPLMDLANAGTPLGLSQPAVFFLEPFLTGGPLVLGLVYMMLFLTAGIASIGEDRARWSLLGFLSAAGLLFFHTGMGLMVLGVTVISIPVVWVSATLNPFRGPGRELTGILLPIALAALVTAPYLRTLMMETSGSVLQFVDVNPTKALFLVLCWLPSLIFGGATLVSFLGGAGVRRQAWTVWTVMMAVVAMSLSALGPRPWVFPAVLAHVPLALTAGAAVPTWWRMAGGIGKVILAAMLALCLVPVTVLGMAGYFRAEDPRTDDSDYLAAVEWVQEHTSPHAILVAGLPDLALAAGRPLLIGRFEHLETWNYPTGILAPRKLVFSALLTGSAIPPVLRDQLTALDAPVYVVHQLKATPNPVPPQESEEVFRNDAVVIYSLAPVHDASAGDPGR